MGGIFSGDEGIKTQQESDEFGGTTGEPHDAWYHEACDTIDITSLEAMGVNADVIAYATLSYAMSKEEFNGGRSKNRIERTKSEIGAARKGDEPWQ